MGLISDVFERRFVDVSRGMEKGSIIGLLAGGAAPELDYGALNVFLRTGMFLADTTPFRFIRTLLPVIPSIPECRLSRPAIVDGYIDLFRQSMRRLLQSHRDEGFVVGLSGGRDSRHILLEVCMQGRRPEFCWTIDTPYIPEEMKVARALAERCQVRHRTIERAGGVEAEKAKNVLTNFCSRQHAWIVNAPIALDGLRHAYDGIAGDVLSESTTVTPARVKLFEEKGCIGFAEHLVGELPRSVLARSAPFPSRDDAVGRVANELARHEGAPNPVASFFFWNRTRRDIGESAFSLLQSNGMEVHAPFLDDDLFMFLSSLRPQETLKTRLHSECIAKAYPEFADIPYASRNPTRRQRSFGDVVRAARYCLRENGAMTSKFRAFSRLGRAVVLSKYRNDVDWIVSTALYLNQLGNLQRPAVE